MQVKLIELRLENFKGIKEFVLSAPAGESLAILGENATGKTTLMDAYTWLLTDKDSQDQATGTFEIKNLDAEGEAAHNLTHAVQGSFLLDGERLSLRKVYYEKYTKKRGSPTAELTGHTSEHFIDDVPATQAQFKARVAEIANPDLFKLLSNIRHFNEVLPWQKRRTMLLDVCGDVTDVDVIASNNQLARLPGIIGKKSIDDWRKVAAAQKAKINEELKEIPARIDEAEKSKADVGNARKAPLMAEVETLAAILREKQAERQRIESGGELAEKRKALAELEAKLIQLDNDSSLGIAPILAGKRLALEAKRAEHSKVKSALFDCQERIAATQATVAALAIDIENLRDQWREIDAAVFVFEPTTTCPTCGQDLPEDQVDAARTKAMHNFNEAKSIRLATISEAGKKKRSEMDQKSISISEMRTLAGELSDAVLGIESEIVLLEQELVAPAVVTESPERALLLDGKSILEAAISELQLGNTDALVEVNAEIVALEKKLSESRNVLSAMEGNARAEARIKELSSREKELAREFEQLEAGVYLTDQFIRAKVSMLSDRINNRFRGCRFKLFDLLVNGAVAEMCETTVNGVPYRNLNEAAKINAGIEIANVIGDHYRISLPQWLDGMESCLDVCPSPNQQIKLIVSAGHPELTIIKGE